MDSVEEGEESKEHKFCKKKMTCHFSEILAPPFSMGGLRMDGLLPVEHVKSCSQTMGLRGGGGGVTNKPN